MIPQRLVLKNFLSYREATLEFRGLHTACICGANGAGKSSLLEAIAWAIWGESRVTSEDDIIHMGTADAQVDFTFITNQHTYRIIRTRQRNVGTSLEFQVAKGDASSESLIHAETAGPIFRSLTAKGIRATQQLILEHLKLDYETFTNSAYLRQGRADEFMLKRPTERKQILADLLKLTQYDTLAERSRDQARQLKGQMDLLERNLVTIQDELQQRDAIAQEQTALESDLVQMQQQQTADAEHLQTLQQTQHQRYTWQQQLTWHQQQRRVLEQDCHRLQQELATTQQQQHELEQLLRQESEITTGYAQLHTLQTQEERLANQFNLHQQAQHQRQQYQQQQREKIVQLQSHLQQAQAQLEALQQQDQELQHTLSKAANVEEGVQELHQARAYLAQVDQLQLQASPLFQRRQQLQTHLDRSQARLTARLEELTSLASQLRSRQAHAPQLQTAFLDISDRIKTLEQRRIYQQQVREKGLERRSFMERLQADQRTYETQLAEVEQKIQLLQQEYENQKVGAKHPDAGNREQLVGIRIHSPSLPFSVPHALAPLSLFPPCPLCDRPLDEHHWQLVLQKHQEEHQAIQNQILVIREQLSASEREIQILRQEYRTLDKELAQQAIVLERRGQLQEQIQTLLGNQQTLQQVTSEITAIQRTLETEDYDGELQEELRLLDQTLGQLNYDEKNHAIARGEVDRWRWAEIKYAEIKQAKRRQAQIADRTPELQKQVDQLQAQCDRITQETTTQLATLDQAIAAICYSLEQHNAVRLALRQAQTWQFRYQEFCQARQQYPLVLQRLAELQQTLEERQQGLKSIQVHIATHLQNLQHSPDCQLQIQKLEQRLQQRRTQLDQQLASLGRLQQQLQHLENLSNQQIAIAHQLQTTRRQHRIYQELAQAFGKNGIQALMIENVLPQLEAETNRILSRLSASQLHIQFITQRSRSSSKPKGNTQKLIETLDILIADANGTRPYETYSGGEAFRVNFAIRLALARLLAQRSGTALQMLIVDEGFGTQDAEGCDRLIAAINAIASDFACILTITHVPHFKEAFQSRIEVFKTQDGSQLQLVV